MATQKPISTISYNSEFYLKEKLDLWVSNHLIQCYAYIKHKGEDGDKDHIHLRLEPNKRVDPMDLQDELKEYFKGEKKPRGVRPFRPSKEEDWFLYAVHDPEYISLKYGNDKDGKIEYSWQDIIANDGYDVEIAYIRAKQSLKHTAPSILSQLERGTSAGKLIREGESPFVVGSVLRFLQSSEYEDLANKFADLHSDYLDLEARYKSLLIAIDRSDLLFDEESCSLVSKQVVFDLPFS